MNVSVVVVVVVAVFTSVTAPLILGARADKRHREDRDADYARQDRVAAQAAEAARLLQESQTAIAAQAAEAARLLVVNNEAVATTAAETQGQLKVIHTLVNSSLTEAKQGKLDADRISLALMRRLIVNPTPDEVAQMEEMARSIRALEVELADRLDQTNIAQAQAQAQAPGAQPQTMTVTLTGPTNPAK